MAEITIIVSGRSYQIACRDGEEERLRLLAGMVDARATDVVQAVGRGDEGRELLLTALLLADDLDEGRSTTRSDDEAAAAIEAAAERLEQLATRLAEPRPAS